MKLNQILKSLNPLKRVNSILTKYGADGYIRPHIRVSIPSSGSIQFLQDSVGPGKGNWDYYRLNPLKRVNSILTLERATEKITEQLVSQSPQAGQFNSYLSSLPELVELRKSRLNPLKRVNSILTSMKSPSQLN